jgi:glycosyltransferase involved in cell wall biosynthesis
VTGRVPDVRPYVFHATAAVAPMRIARGIQNKVLEAMALGRPVIVTAGALEGIEAEPGQEIVQADTAEDFAAAACRLASGTRGAAIGEAARRRVLRDYDWSARLSRFDALLRPVAQPDRRTDTLVAAGS